MQNCPEQKQNAKASPIMKRNFNPDRNTKAIVVATTMPASRHSISNLSSAELFDIRKSEVVEWLCKQPVILQAMFNYYRDKGAIVFDSDSLSWKGRNTP